MEHDEAKRRFKGLSTETQLRVLAAFAHKLTIAARDTYGFSLGVYKGDRGRPVAG
jgi:hypothetical protein